MGKKELSPAVEVQVCFAVGLVQPCPVDLRDNGSLSVLCTMVATRGY